MTGDGKRWITAVIVAFIVPTVIAIGAFFTLRADVSRNTVEIERKADHAVVDVQFSEILRRLGRIEDKVDRIN